MPGPRSYEHRPGHAHQPPPPPTPVHPHNSQARNSEHTHPIPSNGQPVVFPSFANVAEALDFAKGELDSFAKELVSLRTHKEQYESLISQYVQDLKTMRIWCEQFEQSHASEKRMLESENTRLVSELSKLRRELDTATARTTNIPIPAPSAHRDRHTAHASHFPIAHPSGSSHGVPSPIAPNLQNWNPDPRDPRPSSSAGPNQLSYSQGSEKDPRWYPSATRPESREDFGGKRNREEDESGRLGNVKKHQNYKASMMSSFPAQAQLPALHSQAPSHIPSVIGAVTPLPAPPKQIASPESVHTPTPSVSNSLVPSSVAHTSRPNSRGPPQPLPLGPPRTIQSTEPSPVTSATNAPDSANSNQTFQTNGGPAQSGPAPSLNTLSEESVPPQAQTAPAPVSASTAPIPAPIPAAPSHPQAEGPKEVEMEDENREDFDAITTKNGSDWLTMFNPNVERKLDVGLVHTFIHQSVVCCVKFSPDGTMLATGCNRNTTLYNTITGATICVLVDETVNPTQDNYVRSAAFDRAGKFLATGSEDKIIRIWDLKTRRVSKFLQGHKSEIYSLAFTPDGKRLISGSGDRTARMWNVEAATCIYTIVVEDSTPADAGSSDGGVTSVVLSPDGRFLAAGSLDTVVRVWDASDGKQLDRLKGHKDSVYSVAFSPDGKFLVSGSLDKTLKLWDMNSLRAALASGKDASPDVSKTLLMTTLHGHKDYVLSVDFSPDGKWIVSGSKDRGVQFWDPATGKAQFMLQGHKNSVIAVAVSPDGGHAATGSGDWTARIWNYRPIEGQDAPPITASSNDGSKTPISTQVAGEETISEEQDVSMEEDDKEANA